MAQLGMMMMMMMTYFSVPESDLIFRCEDGPLTSTNFNVGHSVGRLEEKEVCIR